MAGPEELQHGQTGGSTDIAQGHAGDDHAGPLVIGADPASVRAGHEPDQVSVKGILVVPGIIVVGFVIAYITVTVLIRLFEAPDPARERGANPLALKQAKREFNAKLDTITEPLAKGGREQPRLEGLKEYEYKQGDEPYTRSRLPAGQGNSPEYHPEDLRPDNVPRLRDGYGWDEEGKVAHIPIDRAIELAAKNKSVLPTQPNPIDPSLIGAPGRPGRQTDSGRGIPASPAAKVGGPEPPKGKEETKDKEQPKKDEGKKEAGSKEKGPQPREKGAPEGKKS